MGPSGGLLREAAGVLVGAVRLLVRHWPVLGAIALAGVAFRGAALWAAVEVSDRVNWLGHGLVIVAPLGFLVAMIAMLHVLRRDLPNSERVLTSVAPVDATTGRERRLVDVATSMVVPFFAVYVSYGFLAQDVAHFVNQAGVDELGQADFYGTGTGTDFDRVFLTDWWLVAGLVLAAWVLRFLLGTLERRWNYLVLAMVGALVEVYWSANVAGYVDGMRDTAEQWLHDRVAVAQLREIHDGIAAGLGPLSQPFTATTTWLVEILGSLDAIVIVPMAWLAVGAVVLGHELAPPPSPEHPWLARAQRMPRPVVQTLGGLTDDVASRFTALFSGVRMMARAGLVPMLLFGVATALAMRAPYVISTVWRSLTGPVDSDTYVAWAPIEAAVENAVMLVLLAVLLAAAVDWMLRTVNPTAPQRDLAAPTTATPR